ncbi:MAG: TetR/AcrR family transcriptional regulator [Clostridia bacterium]|nr:TetR/AcrR family transcriptional regulator [Clostridia bacterium]
MPIPFTAEEQASIRLMLLDAAQTAVIETPVRKITVEQLTKAAGISKGAFYKFYETKELLFYELMRHLHDEMYAPAMSILTEPSGLSPAEVLTRCILSGCEILENSKMKRFWTEDSAEIMAAVPMELRAEQHTVETGLLRQFFRQHTLRVPEPLAMDAIRALLLTVHSRNTLGTNYPTILQWMAQGVCDSIFA